MGRKEVRNRFSDESGAALVAYTLLVALICMIAYASVDLLGAQNKSTYSNAYCWIGHGTSAAGGGTGSEITCQSGGNIFNGPT